MSELSNTVLRFPIMMWESHVSVYSMICTCIVRYILNGVQLLCKLVENVYRGIKLLLVSSTVGRRTLDFVNAGTHTSVHDYVYTGMAN